MITRRQPRQIHKHLLLKAASLAVGYILWSALAGPLRTTRFVHVTIRHGIDTDLYTVHVPSTVTVEVEGPRNKLSLVEAYNPTLHIDGTALSEGTHSINTSHTKVMLPHGVECKRIIEPSIALTKERIQHEGGPS